LLARSRGCWRWFEAFEKNRQIPVDEHADKAKPLEEHLQDLMRKKGPRLRREILPVVLSRRAGTGQHTIS
jgi:hypothetical protein